MKISERTKKKLIRLIEKQLAQNAKKYPLTMTIVFFLFITFSLITFVFAFFISTNPSYHLETEKFFEINQNQNNKTYAYVTRVVDGDTIQVEIKNEQFTIRLIGIDTPETEASRKEVECFGHEAKEFLKKLVESKKVELLKDSTQSEQDRYGRLLRYVLLDGINVNLKLLEEGYAYEYTFRDPYMMQASFKKAETQAMEKKLGLWGEICEGKRRYI